MSEEHASRLWVCTRCGRRKGIELEPDPVLLKVCDECKIQNWCRNPKGAGLVITAVLEEAEPEPKEEPRTIEEIEDDFKATGMDEKQAEILALKAQLAELEGNE